MGNFKPNKELTLSLFVTELQHDTFKHWKLITYCIYINYIKMVMRILTPYVCVLPQMV